MQGHELSGLVVKRAVFGRFHRYPVFARAGQVARFARRGLAVGIHGGKGLGAAVGQSEPQPLLESRVGYLGVGVEKIS